VSYCRWSCDDFQCDLYCFESCYGGYETNVAGKRYVFAEPLPPPVEMDPKNTEAWLTRYRAVREILDRSEMQPIGLPHDGATFNDDTPQEFLATLLMLREAGYRFPDYVLGRVREEIADTPTAKP